MSNSYQCGKCGGTFEKDWTDEEARQETKRLWGDLPEEDLVVVCDDCFIELVPWAYLQLN